MRTPEVLLLTWLAAFINQRRFGGFKNSLRYFTIIHNAKGSVEVSTAELRIDPDYVERLHKAIEAYAATKNMLVGSAVKTDINGRKLYFFEVWGEAFHLLIDNSYEEGLFTIVFGDHDQEDWHLYRDDFVAYLQSIFGVKNVRVVEG